MTTDLKKTATSGNLIPLNDNDYYKLSSFIRTNFGINLTEAKRTLLESRLQKRLRLSGITSFKEYIKKVCEGHHHAELINMINVVTTNKTDFFREKTHYDYVLSKILPEHAALPAKKELNIWSAASSTGEEAYTMAMVIEEFNRLTNNYLKYTIDASDISTEVLKKGIQAVYRESDIAAIANGMKQSYFLRSKEAGSDKVRVVKKLREKVKFFRFNLMSNAYPTREKYDIIFCRNVLIYFDRTTQEQVIQKLCESLKTGGYLFLGHSESIIGLNVPLKQLIHTGYKKIS
ncbi:chemotaxis protein methyltransferase [Marivirga lumbricoides]|uniref:protein-glutamate O-methyltransferase n=1 Tax=Marivirga lumbricoides TaxID=1046115 RepID=A0ABQ1N239_9BACT|nr:chemotaxis protein methyltransferase [Marivirga lumbricoides]